MLKVLGISNSRDSYYFLYEISNRAIPEKMELRNNLQSVTILPG